LFDNVYIKTLLDDCSRLKNILLDNKRHWVKCVALSVAGPLGPGAMYPSQRACL